jgi:uncharacterized protein YdeI (BOF family)
LWENNKGKLKMKKIILVATMLAFSTSAFAATTPVVKAPKAKVVHSACDSVKNPTACKSTVHHKAPKKKKK